MRKNSTKFWIAFWLSALIFLTAWFFYWQNRFRENSFLGEASQLLSTTVKKNNLETLLNIGEKFLKNDDREKVFLILFQNNLELRPGGGFIGSFGILKIKNGSLSSFSVHDTGNFDGRIPETQKPPFPMEETLRINSWKLRDSNYSPDYPTNVAKALEFYYLGDGQEKFDGVIGITTSIFESLLEITGPITLADYPGSYDSQNAILLLERQVEIDYREQGIEKGDRKAMMNELGEAILQKISTAGNTDKIRLANKIMEGLQKKDIQLNFTDAELQAEIEKNNWAGKLASEKSVDFLMPVDANLAAYKSDYYIRRNFNYTLDLSEKKPLATLKITYSHTAEKKDWMTKDYQSYLRVYVPQEAWLTEWKNLPSPRFEEELNKKYFGFLVQVPLGQSKTVELRYELPEEIKKDYRLLVQKQAGLKNANLQVKIKFPDGTEKNWDENFEKDLFFPE